MGRHRKYNSEEERKEAQRKWSMDYYKRNRAVLQAKARERYRKKRKKEFKDVVHQYLYAFTSRYDKDGDPYLTDQEVEDVKKVWALRLPSLGIKQKL